MLIKDDKRIMTENGLQTYRNFGFTVHFHNIFFSGSIIVLLKFNYRVLNHAVDKIKHSISFASVTGLDTKYLTIQMVTIPKGKK